MKKYEIVKKNTLFNDIINRGKFFKNSFYSIYFKNSDDDFPKFGLAVSKKCGNAVERNKIKRQLRVIVDNNKNLFESQKDYIIMIRKEAALASFKEKEQKLVELLNKRGKKINEKI